jgi:hypothetical protein
VVTVAEVTRAPRSSLAPRNEGLQGANEKGASLKVREALHALTASVECIWGKMLVPAPRITLTSHLMTMLRVGRGGSSSRLSWVREQGLASGVHCWRELGPASRGCFDLKQGKIKQIDAA